MDSGPTRIAKEGLVIIVVRVECIAHKSFFLEQASSLSMAQEYSNSLHDVGVES
jgi:hypothetical protein